MGGYKEGGGRSSPRSPHRRSARLQVVGDLVQRVIKSAGMDRSNRLEAVRLAWREAVGRRIAEGTAVKALKGGQLLVEVDSAALAHELSVYYRKQLIGRLRERASVRVQDIRFKVVGDLEALDAETQDKCQGIGDNGRAPN